MENNFTKFKQVLYLLIILSQFTLVFNIKAQWNATNGVGGGFVYCIAAAGSDLYIGTQGYGIFKSTDNGNSWLPADSGLGNKYVYSLVSAGPNIIAGTRQGVYYSSDNGHRWNVGDSTLMNFTKWVYTLTVGPGGNVYAGTKYHNANDPKTTFYSGNNGLSWQTTPVNPVFSGTNCEVYSVYTFSGSLFAGTNHGVFKTNDGGFTWLSISTGTLGTDKSVYSLTQLGTKLVAGTYQNGVYWSSDGGSSFFAQNVNFSTSFPVFSLTTSGSTVFATSFGNTVYKAYDGSFLNWTNTISVGLPDKYLYCIYNTGSSIFSASFFSGVYKTVDSCAHWSYASNGITGTLLSSLASNNNTMYATTVGCGMFVSTDNGNNWVASNSGINTIFQYSLTPYSVNMFAGTAQGVFLTTNNGSSWVLSGLLNKKIISMSTIGTGIFAGESVVDTSGNLYISNDGGQTWPLIYSPPDPITCFTNIGTNILFGTRGSGVYLSLNGGTAWNVMNNGLSNLFVNSITSLGTSTVAVGTNQGVFVSTDLGSVWTSTSLTYTTNGLANDGTNIIAATNAGIYLSKDMGSSWLVKNDGLYTDTVANCVLIANSDVLIGMFPIDPKADQIASLIWKRTLNNLVIGIKNISSEVPDKFQLMQNYPNPFNPTTIVRWQMKENALVTLKIFDITGRQIGVYVNEKLKAGVYETKIDASGLSSGVYFYRLQAGNFVDTKKMILLK